MAVKRVLPPRAGPASDEDTFALPASAADANHRESIPSTLHSSSSEGVTASLLLVTPSTSTQSDSSGDSAVQSQTNVLADLKKTSARDNMLSASSSSRGSKGFQSSANLRGESSILD